MDRHCNIPYFKHCEIATSYQLTFCNLDRRSKKIFHQFPIKLWLFPDPDNPLHHLYASVYACTYCI